MARTAKPAAKSTATPKPKPTRSRTGAPRRAPGDRHPWALWAAALILGLAVLRLGVNALGWVPVHFDEGQYWAYGRELAFGHFSKPPLVGWVIYLTTSLGGETTFALRIGAVVAQAVVAAFVFLTGRALFDGKTGFLAALGYSLAPGVTVSAMLMTTDPVMMAAWAVALYAWVRAAEGARAWWWVMGVAIGAGMLAKYTMLAFAVGAAGYGLMSARARDWRGAGVAAALALAVMAPNIWWQWAHDFATVAHVAEDAAPGGPVLNPDKLAEFLGAQLGVIGPVWFLAILAGLLWRGWASDWRMRMLAWQTFTLLLPVIFLALLTRAQPNWAAPAYVAGSICAARLILERGWRWAPRVQIAAGALAAMVLYVAAWAYHAAPLQLPRGPDPFKKMRLSEPFCERALAAMAEEGAEVLLSNDRRRLSECMFLGTLTFQDIAVWNPEPWPENHHELVASLRPGDDRRMILAVLLPDAARRMARHFDEAREVDSGTIATHDGRAFAYAIWVVQGFREY